MEEYRPKADGRAVHENEFARHHYRPALFQRLVDLEGFLAAVFRRLHAVGHAAHPIVEQGTVDEACPYIERLDQLAAEALEAPDLVGVHDAIVIAGQQTTIEIDHAADETRREDADAAVVE